MNNDWWIGWILGSIAIVSVLVMVVILVLDGLGTLLHMAKEGVFPIRIALMLIGILALAAFFAIIAAILDYARSIIQGLSHKHKD